MNHPSGESNQAGDPDARLWRELRGAMSGSAGACIDPADLAAYVDARVDASEADRIEAHLACCRQCLDAVAETRRLLTGPPMYVPAEVIKRAKALVPAAVPTGAASSRRRLRLPVAAQWAAAAVAALAVGYGGFRAGRATGGPRRGPAEIVAAEASFGLNESPSPETVYEDLFASSEGRT